MLSTPLGNIEICINKSPYCYMPVQLPTVAKSFIVDGRYKISIALCHPRSCDTVIECKLLLNNDRRIKTFVESGEKLSLLSFYYDNTKLSIGVEDELRNAKNEYLNCGIKTTVSKHFASDYLEFVVAWLKMRDREKEDNYTWFAADPTFY